MDTIAAVSTARAPAAISIVRLSGEESRTLLTRVFRPLKGRLSEPRRMVYGEFTDAEDCVIDRGLAVFFPAGESYTGEEMAELYLHGSPMVAELMLRTLYHLGARAAEAGEFSRRAFLNGRMDLSEAEAIGDLLEADSEAAVRNAAAQLSGALRRRVEPLYDGLMAVASRFYAVVDHPDEDIRDLSREEIGDALTAAEKGIERLLGTFRRGSVLKRGIPVAILGAPNAGKSSLLNYLLGYDRAIVTDTPGTTRDTLEEKISFAGLPLRLIDTAGLRESDDAVEKLGMERSRAAAEEAELLLVLVDGTRPPTKEDKELLYWANDTLKPFLYVQTKSDLGATVWERDELLPEPLLFSCVTGEGTDRLEYALRILFPDAEPDAPGSLLTNERQYAAAEQALAAVRRAEDAYASGLTPDAVLTDAEEALRCLGELTGRTAREDLVHQIFSRFCVGK